jgi:hypothetical protein
VLSSLLPVFVVLLGVAGSAEEGAFVDVGFSVVCPVVGVVDVAVPGCCVTAWPLAMSVAGDDGFALGAAPHPGFAADVEDFSLGADDDAGEGTVAGGHAEGVDVDDDTVDGLVETAGDALEGGEIGYQVDVWFLSADGGGGSVVEPVPAQVFEGVVSSLPGCPLVVVMSGWGEGGDPGEECFSGGGGEPPVDFEHPADGPGGGEPTS